MTGPHDPSLDLVLERTVDVPSERLWAGWTQPELLQQWFTPAPWKTTACEIDLRPGGVFRTVMRGPEGQQFDNAGCYLEIDPGRRLVWTGALGPGFRPRTTQELVSTPFFLTASISLEARGSQTQYRAWVLHGDALARDKHAAMGFHTGWAIALEQLVALCKQG